MSTMVDEETAIDRELAELLDLPKASRLSRIRIALARVRFPRLKRPRMPRISQERRTDVCFLLGLAAFAGGCGWIYPPAWLIVGGFFLAAVAWLDQRGRTDEPKLREPSLVIERWGPGDDEDMD